MKWNKTYQIVLQNEGFPPEWIESAISYSQLKKCIKRLTKELRQMGLDPPTLDKLLKHVEDYNASTTSHLNDRPFEYILSDGTGSKKTFQPKLLFYVDEATGGLHGAKFDAETSEKLQMLAVETGVSDVKIYEVCEPEEPEPTDSPRSDDMVTANPSVRPGYRIVEIPLTSDTEFFTTLARQLSGLEALESREERRMQGEIEDLGKQIARLTDPDRKANKKVLAAWRQIFQLYVEEDIFFGATERDHSARDAAKATFRFHEFCTKIAELGLVDKVRKKEGAQALNMFMQINRELLQGLRFGEINRTAMSKILKKFDKRTALGVKSTVPSTISYPQFSQDLAKAVCAEVNTQILSHVPQLDDYSCPMCMDLKWRPVKLQCGHTFCIRCLIVMQTNKQDRCPLCREITVVGANSDNLDEELANFLKKWFPEEVKAKQKYNELMAGVDAYGEVYKDKCSVM
ncbi:RING-14 protein [Periconia macrospinosa]|uniref:RING-14 protein n=1 Tax=Periconia macrospinosa TaxID=97972 RepID=A0A2V1EBG5_9PLEO|nr:RING-14 protein [Periconia macrospinosa]